MKAILKMIEYENLSVVNKEFEDEYKIFFKDFIDSGWYILGKSVEKFEKDFAEFVEVDSFVGVASGLDAITLSLDALNLPLNSEVIVPSNTYIATILAIVKAGLKPILVEPDISTYNIDPYKIEEKISKNTKVILVVHLYGKPCDMDYIMDLANKYSLSVVEDCAQAHGAKYKNKKVGSFGTGAFSFYPTKNLGALGDAGGIATNDKKIFQKLQSLRNYGSSKKYINDYIGMNSRLDELQAGFLSIKLKKIDKIIEHKRKLASIYLKSLKDDFIKPVVEDDYFDVYHIFQIRHEKRDNIKDYLFKNGIKTEVHYPIPPHKQKAMKDILQGEYKISEKIHKEVLSLPISYCHSEDDIKKVCKVLNEF